MAFARAIEAVPGLEIYAEDVADIIADDGVELAGHFYLVLPDQAALGQLLRLWELWSNDQDMGADHNAWKSVFECLHDLRRWGPRDRVSKEDANILADEIALAPEGHIQVEIELVFDSDEAAAVQRRAELDATIAENNGEIVSACRHGEIEYHAVLARLPLIVAQQIAERRDDGLAGHIHILLIRPQSDVRAPGEEGDSEPTTTQPAVVLNKPAIAAIFDAVPIQNHPAFSEHLDFDDPDDLESLAVGPRVHGTAMASLIVQGDLQGDYRALDRKVHLRALLYARGSDEDDEIFHPNRLIVDDFVRAVRRMKVGENDNPPTAPDVIFINVSLGDRKRPFSGRLSPWARALDWLAYEYGVLFLVSAGNTSTLTLQEVGSDEEFRALSGTERARATLAGLRDDMRNRRLLSPAESVNSLTIGAWHHDFVNAAETVGHSLDPLPIHRGANPFSRLGLGFRNGVKPDFLMPGGRLRVHAQIGSRPAFITCSRPNRFGGMRVAGPKLDAQGRPGFDSWSGASSGATALATRASIQIHDAILSAYPEQFGRLTSAARALVVKALLGHRTSYCPNIRAIVEEIFGPTDQKLHQKRRANVQRLFGLGQPDIEEVIACIGNRATLWGVGSVGENDAAEFVVPLPVSLSRRRGLRRLTATVAWFSPIVTGMRSYKSVRLVVQEPADSVRILTGPLKGQPDQNESARGTLFHRCWEGRAAREFVDGSHVIIPVSRMPDPGEDDLFPELLPFGISVTLETEAVDIPVYVEVREKIAVKPIVRVPVPVTPTG